MRTLDSPEPPRYPAISRLLAGETNTRPLLASGRTTAQFLREDGQRSGRMLAGPFVLYACAGWRMQVCLGLVEHRSFVRGMLRGEGKNLKRRPTTQSASVTMDKEEAAHRNARTHASGTGPRNLSGLVGCQAVRTEGPHRTRLCRTLLTPISTGMVP